MAENPSQYAQLANEGILLGYPVKIQGQTHRADNGIGYHSSIKFFDPVKDHPHTIHDIAQHLPLNAPDAKNTQIEPGQFKDRFGNDVYVIKMKGNSADKIKEHNGKFAHMGFPANYVYAPHISVDKATWDKVKSSGAKTAKEAGIEFGPAELKKGPKTLKTYHHEPDSADPKVPDEGDMTAKATAKSENVAGQKPLMKPYVSEAQRRWAHTKTGKEALGGEAGVHEWDEATKGKKLPERVSKSEQSSESTKPNVKINPEHGKTIANAYENMKHDPNHPDVKNAYHALIGETRDQFKNLLGSGLKVSQIKPGQSNPYKNSKEMHHDVKNNGHLWYFPTDQGFGGEEQHKDHPMLAPSGFMHEGKHLLANDIFRIVHDVNGHHKGGETGFGPTGEHQAYLTHKKQYSPLAQKALASETMGQNNWVNFGPHGENNRKNPAQTKFADQKAGLMPDEVINGKWHNEE